MKSTRACDSALEEGLVSLFSSRPELSGFTVRMEGELTVSDIGVYPLPAADELRALCEDIRTTLADVMEQEPEAWRLLTGRTFARRFH